MKFRFTNNAFSNVPTSLPADVRAAIADGREMIVWDTATPGFGVRFRGTTSPLWMIKYSLHARATKMALGKVGAVSFEDAKIAAQEAFSLVAKGQSPKTARAVEEARTGIAFMAWSERFYEWLKTRDRSESWIGATKLSLEMKFKALHKYGVGEIQRSMVADALTSIEKNHGYRACGNARTHLSKYFNFMISQGVAIESNPVTGTESRLADGRDRVHTPQELVLIWKATEDGSHSINGEHFNAIIRLLMLTGARLNDIGRLTHRQFKHNERTIELFRGKNKKPFIIPLSLQATEIIRKFGTRNDETGMMFGRGNEALTYSGWSREMGWLQDRVNELAGEPLEHWTPHDFRRSFQTLGEDLCGIDHNIADASLSHIGSVRKGVKRHYNKANYLAKRRRALQTWADFIDALVAGKITAADLENEEFEFKAAA